jgi:signal transduction histidine kinase
MKMDPRLIRLLLIEDDPGDATLTREMLAEAPAASCCLEWVDSLSAGLRRLTKGDIDLVLLDLGLPDSVGLESLRTLCSGMARALPVVVMSGHGEEEMAMQALQEGAQDYLVKGQVDARSLFRSIRYAIERQNTEEKLRTAHAELERQVAERTATLASTVESLQKENAERKRIEAELQEADRRRTEFLALLSHELRNPLAPIRNSIYVLERAAAGSDQAERARAIIKRQVGQLTRLVDDLLDATRITRGKIHLQLECLDLNQLVSRTLEDHRNIFERSGLCLEFRPARQPIHVCADPVRLAQVIGNLLHNSAKFTPAGGKAIVEIAVDQAHQEAVLAIRDTGRGIAPEVLPRLFKPFSQADTSLDRRLGGLGLGLALVKNLVEMHGGSVEGDSNGLGRGAVFTIRLPLET